MAKRGNERTEAQKAAAARNLLHQAQTAVDDALQQDAVKAGRNGYMSKATKAKVKTLVDTMIFLRQLPEAGRQTLNERLGYTQQACYLTFVTLTLPAAQLCDEAGEPDDKRAKDQLLRPMLERLKYTFGVRAFVWVAEPQENGNIHFHLLIDKYIDNTKHADDEAKSQVLTKAWNEILARHGYVERYREAQLQRHADGFAYETTQRRRVEELNPATGKYETRYQAVSYADQVEAYAYGQATDWQQPNTVDIHRLRAQNDIKGYICKYLTKNDGSEDEGTPKRRKISGALWGAADALRAVEAYREEFSDELRGALVRMDEQHPGSVRVLLVTGEGPMTVQEFEDNELQGRVPVMATIYSYNQALFWKFAPASFRWRFEAYYRAAFRRIYAPEQAAPLPPVELEDIHSPAALVGA